MNSNGDVSGDSGIVGDPASRFRVLLSRSVAALVTLLRHAPLSISLAVIYVAAGIATGSAWRAIGQTEWLDRVGYGVPAMESGQYWTLITGIFFGLTPWQFISIVIMLITVAAWAESRLGTPRLAAVMIGGQLVGIGIALLFSWGLSDGVISGIRWDWPTHLASIRDVGMTTAIVGAASAASATLSSPWRLRFRLILAVYVAVSLFFEGTLADVAHIASFALMLLVGEKRFSGSERGFAPRTRREVRLLAFAGLIAIVVADLMMWFFPGSGPLRPTDADGTAVWLRWVEIAIVVAIAWQLRRGKRWAWTVCLVVGVINIVGLLVVIVLVATIGFQAVGGIGLGTSLLWLALTWVLISGRFAFHVPARVGIGAARDVVRAKELLRRYGGGTMSWMTTWEGNHYQFLGSGQGYVAFQRHAGVLIALTDPVCVDDRREEAVRGFIDLAESSGLTPCWFSVGNQTAAAARSSGWRTVKIAEDSIVDLEGLEFKGKSWQGVRTALNKAKKLGIEHRLVRLADQPLDIRAQVTGISDEWIGGKGLPEMGFTLGGIDEALDDDVYTSLATDQVGDVLGVLSWLPVYGGAGVVVGWTLDVMRRTGDEFGPVIEFLLGSAMLEFKAQGAQFVSLSGAPLAGDDATGAKGGAERVLDKLGAAMEPLYGFRSLHAFKKKFRPRYEPVYLAYRDEGDLPRIGLAISRAYLPNATPRQLGRMAMSAKS
ncbi:hypothetical protein GOHSU_56_00080 [Gordonia hirsuta DSM 44140 = NBRC 16056]|uniref:Phosphatidylglycerol lysyltransferase C-terminal domain-containing protein n=1 Tax=Gordonia hirsuta DSM 44140 = NBRC 16056 TaxID=1121927 RepID=L7LCL6_9ACTN|nr:DUF2156 domain-containing protein [Gordonia hirsuta]GAC58875.1 hypothetical protein GOHSU_56_00080 [Gordonia hirsuta DSM 44140 = NBRC 16056]